MNKSIFAVAIALPVALGAVCTTGGFAPVTAREGRATVFELRSPILNVTSSLGQHERVAFDAESGPLVVSQSLRGQGWTDTVTTASPAQARLLDRKTGSAEIKSDPA